jgi:hypothetical protein
MYVNSATIDITNSTIARNTDLYAGAVVVGTRYGSVTMNLNSALISNNYDGTTEDDFYAQEILGNTVTIGGSHNLIRTAVANVPGDTKAGCPLLGPLRDNGGPTWTHALYSGSPAINTGNNALTLPYDQRGAPFARVAKAIADIGAYEVQTEVVFSGGFEGCQ